MDFKTLIAQKQQNLKACSTVVTHSDGRKFKITDGKCKEIERGLPFVVDNKPDMQIATIIPGLFLSSQDPTTNIETLEAYKIKHILSLGVEPTVRFENIGYSFIEMLDLPETDLADVVKRCIKIIEEHKRDHILVHCNAGISRSASIVISYLMVSEKISYDEAYKRVKTARSCIKPNDGFVTQLKKIDFDNFLISK